MRRFVVYGLSTAGAVAGAIYAFDFGRQISGSLLGVLLGLNGFVFCALVIGMALEWLWPQKNPPASPAQSD